MENLVYFMWLICSILYPSPDIPYLPDDEMHCAPMSDMMCCELQPEVLRSTELWCLTGGCSWSLEGYGYH
mgnify:CR=1 FL=1